MVLNICNSWTTDLALYKQRVNSIRFWSLFDNVDEFKDCTEFEVILFKVYIEKNKKEKKKKERKKNLYKKRKYQLSPIEI